MAPALFAYTHCCYIMQHKPILQPKYNEMHVKKEGYKDKLGMYAFPYQQRSTQTARALTSLYSTLEATMWTVYLV